MTPTWALHSELCDSGGPRAAGRPSLWPQLSPPVPGLTGRNSLGIHMRAFRSISSCSPALWKVLFRHVLLSGGTGSCAGLRFRMQRELSALVSPLINVKVRPPAAGGGCPRRPVDVSGGL